MGGLVPLPTTDLRPQAPRLRRLGRRHPLVLITIGVFLYSTGPVLVQASSVSGPVFSLWRLWFGVAVLGVAAAVDVARGGGRPARRAWRVTIGAGAAFGAHQLLVFSAIKATSVADVTLVNTLSPIVTAALAVPMFGERPGATFRFWSVVAMGGAAVVVFGGASGPEGDPVGMTLALANVVAFAVFFLLSKRSREHLGVLPFLFGVFTVAAVFVSAYVVVAGEAVASVTATDLLYAAVVAAGPGFVGHFVMTWPLRWTPANVPPVMRLGIPVLAGTWAWWFLGEPVTVLHLFGGAITLLGVAGALLTPSARALAAGAGDEDPSSG
jgi:drug/metabolite transporter (DMT)-like permease